MNTGRPWLKTASDAGLQLKQIIIFAILLAYICVAPGCGTTHVTGAPVDGLPNVIWTGEGDRLRPVEGYQWVNPNNHNDNRVEPIPSGIPHDKHPNVVWAGDGKNLHPAEGYQWMNPNDPRDLRVVREEQTRPNKPHADETPAAIESAPSNGGIYSVQAMLDFDRLETVIFDPATQTISLFGSRRSAKQKLPIAYLEHLATALKYSSSTFSLEPGPETKAGAGKFLGTAAANFDIHAFRLMGKRKLADLLAATKSIPKGPGRERVTAEQLGIEPEFDSLARKKQEGKATREDQRQYSRHLLQRLAAAGEINPQKLLAAFDKSVAQGVDPHESQQNMSPVFYALVMEQLKGVYPTLSKEGAVVHTRGAEFRDLSSFNFDIVPTWTGIDPHSDLARIQFEADVLLKLLVVDPSFRKLVPGHKTYFDYLPQGIDTSSSSNGLVRLEIRLDSVDMSESADGKVVEIRSVRFKVVSDSEALRGYAAFLTSEWPRLVEAFPILLELEECSKMVAVAQWMQKRSYHVNLPTPAPVWEPPLKTNGSLAVSFTLPGGSIFARYLLSGGVRLNPADTVHIRQQSSVPTVDKVRTSISQPYYKNETLKRILSKHITVPVPAPPGWTASAKLGERKLEGVQLLTNRLRDKASIPDVQLHLQNAERLAGRLSELDHILDAFTKRRISRQAALGEINTWASGEKARAIKDLVEGVNTTVRDWFTLRPEVDFRLRIYDEVLPAEHRTTGQTAAVIMGKLEKLQNQVLTLKSDIDVAQDARRSGSDVRRYLQAAERTVAAMAEIQNQTQLLQVGRYTVHRSLFYAHALKDIAFLSAGILQARSQQAVIDNLARSTGNDAILQQGIGESRDALIRELNTEIEKAKAAGK
jgi:hypothetical protein